MLRRPTSSAAGSDLPHVVLRLPEESAPLLLRIAITSPTWAEAVPPVPQGADITVAFSDPEVEAEHADAVAQLGYRPVGAVDVEPIDLPAAEFLIPRSACDRWPVWRDELLHAGGQVWDLGFGPAAALLRHRLVVHRAAAR
jgi:hypothetical protein